MGIIFANPRCKNPKKKPGWQQRAAEEAAWLKSLNGSSLAPGKTPVTKKSKKIKPIDKKLDASAVEKLKAAYVIDTGTKKVLRPEITYRDSPELIKREIEARQRKFATAPAYNKGGAILVTDEMMKDIISGATRRRP